MGPIDSRADVSEDFNPYVAPAGDPVLAPEEVFLSTAVEGRRGQPHWDWLDVSLMVGVFFGLFAPAAVVLFLVRRAMGPSPASLDVMLALGLGLLLVQFLASIGAVYGVGRFRRGYGWSDIGFRPMTLSWWAISAGAGLACLPLLGIVAVLTSKLIGQKELENPQLDFLAPGGQFSWGAGLGMFALAGLLVPLAEEIFFRGVLYPWARRALRVWPAALLVGVLFGIFHMNVVIGAAVAPLGVMAALLYEYSGSLWSAVTVHAVNNGLKILVLYALLATGLTPEKLRKMAQPEPANIATVRLPVETLRP